MAQLEKEINKDEAEWFKRLRTSPLGLSVTAIGLILIGVGSFSDSIDKVLVSVGLRPNALRLAEDDARGQFSRELARSAWRRLFWMRRLVLSEKANFPEAEKSETWAAYLKSLEDWNAELMVYIMTIKKYYGDAKALEFQRDVQSKFGKIHYCLEAVRHRTDVIECSVSKEKSLDKINNSIDDLNASLYCFASGLPSKNSDGC
ncbi:hypothetical protein [Methylocystis parvus]|uniref:hypothetical protein n=1 Tax=Methylocystis parvus TaxID=134 RepID=UPI003C72147A